MQTLTRQAFVLSGTIALSWGALAQSAAPITLDVFVARVASEGLAIEAIATDIDVAVAEQDAVGVWPNPRVDLSRQANAAGVRAGETQDQLLVSFPLVVSGRLGLERDSAAEDVAATRARVAHARGRVRHEATDAFLDVAAARRSIAIHRASIAALQPIVDAITARERAGAAAGYDRVRIELEVARLHDGLAAALNDERRALARANALWPPSAGALVLADHDLSRALRDDAAASLDGRGDARALAHSANAAQLAADAAGRAWIPEPTIVGGGYVLDVIARERGVGYAVGVEIPVPIFDRRQGDAARARASANRSKAERAALLHDAGARRAAAIEAAEAARARSQHHDEDVVRRASELLAITTHAYTAGGMELLALMDAERAHIEAELASVALQLAARHSENDLGLISGGYDDKDDKDNNGGTNGTDGNHGSDGNVEERSAP